MTMGKTSAFRTSVALVLLVAGARAWDRKHTFDSGLPQDVLNGMHSPRPDDLVRLSSTAFPDHSVRISRAEGFCDTGGRAYTGYVDTGARHLFFYFFESQRDPENDDVILWINGGPGQSSATGLLMELGPCNVDGPSSTRPNPYSWTNTANVLFLDQPIGVGFSYSDDDTVVSTTEEAANDVVAFVSILSESFSQFRSRRFYIAGESYGGHYIPIFASAILNNNKKLREAGMSPVNLHSVIIGNGASDEYTLHESLYDMQCTHVSGLPPIQPISTCVRMKQATPRCLSALRVHCEDTFDLIDCQAAYHWCTRELFFPLFAIGANPYDVGAPCEGDMMETMCYHETQDIKAYLNAPRTRALLHIDALPATFSLVSGRVNAAFVHAGDRLRPAAPYLGALLARGVRVLVYAGARDPVCSWVAQARMTAALEWPGAGAFRRAEWAEWKDAEGEVLGSAKEAGGLRLVKVDGAGHMVPHDKPEAALLMLEQWLSDEPLLKS